MCVVVGVYVCGVGGDDGRVVKVIYLFIFLPLCKQNWQHCFWSVSLATVNTWNNCGLHPTKEREPC